MPSGASRSDTLHLAMHAVAPGFSSAGGRARSKDSFCVKDRACSTRVCCFSLRKACKMADSLALRVCSWTLRWGSGLTILLVVLWPLLALPAKDFSKGYFTFWVRLQPRAHSSSSLAAGRPASPLGPTPLVLDRLGMQLLRVPVEFTSECSQL
jgi:hypothetical protein